ncbi:MAG: type IV pilin [Candidatus Thermoplasmatota archaeon]
MKANQKFQSSVSAVSEVIGVILMVAITVTIAAVIYLYVSGILGSSSSSINSSWKTLQDQLDKLRGGDYYNSQGGTDGPGGAVPAGGSDDPGGDSDLTPDDPDDDVWSDALLISDPNPKDNEIVEYSESITFSVYITHATEDEDGNIYYEISCSNGESTSQTNVNSGRYSLQLTKLQPSTIYRISIIAINMLNGRSTTAEYQFQTTAQPQPPRLGEPNIPDYAKNQPLSLTWSIPISDDDSLFSWSIEVRSAKGQTFTESATNDISGIKSITLKNLAETTEYTVTVTATDDSMQVVIGLYHFITGKA